MFSWKMLLQPLRRAEQVAFIALASIALTAVLGNLDFHFLEARLYDFRMTRSSQFTPDDRVVLVTLDDATTRGLGEYAPLSLSAHTKLLEALEALQPAGVGYLVNFNYVHQVDPRDFDGDWATRFVDAAERLEDKGSPVVLGTPFDVNGEVLPPYPLNSLQHALAIVHKDGNIFAEDNVTRRAISYLYGRPSFHLELAQRSGLLGQGYKLDGSFEIDNVDANYFLIRYHGSTRQAKNQTTTQSENLSLEDHYQKISFLDVLEGRISPQALRNKIVLVGSLSRENPADFALTPYSKRPFTNPKILVHANILDTILNDQAILSSLGWMDALLTFFCIFVVLWWVLNFTPLYGVLSTIALSGTILIVGQLLFDGVFFGEGIWMVESQPLLGIFLGYYLTVPYRLIREYKGRWEFQRQNEILQQVEELKTNFLSLITHDLKTPVARIQGLAEVVLNGTRSKLDPNDQESLASIVDSTDELNNFIGSLLELTKIDSDRVVIEPQQKDINNLVEKAVKRFSSQAKRRNIEIQTELDPLFPTKVDPDLISKVLANLVDNALKYSPDGSRILITTEEKSPWIVISISDQGIGLSEEDKAGLFTRFFRAKNDTTTKIAGTGLGLYLTRYFVEAHYGEVEVESEPGQGSTFRIKLPLDGFDAQQKNTGVRPGLLVSKMTKWFNDQLRRGA